jgi:archaellum component FlaG (FlaF/FlaG flagellin family)
MGLITWIAIVVIILVVIGLGAGVFFSGLIRGAEIIGTNPAVQNVTQEAKEFLDNNIQGSSSSSSSSSVLVITTNEARYRVDEPVTITVKNIGDETLTFPNSALGLKIQNTNTGQMYNVVAAQVTTQLEPGASRMLTWNQEDGNGNNVSAGDYTATAQGILSSSSAQSVSAQVSFEITE